MRRGIRWTVLANAVFCKPNEVILYPPDQSLSPRSCWLPPSASQLGLPPWLHGWLILRAMGGVLTLSSFTMPCVRFAIYVHSAYSYRCTVLVLVCCRVPVSFL